MHRVIKIILIALVIFLIVHDLFFTTAVHEAEALKTEHERLLVDPSSMQSIENDKEDLLIIEIIEDNIVDNDEQVAAAIESFIESQTLLLQDLLTFSLDYVYEGQEFALAINRRSLLAETITLTLPTEFTLNVAETAAHLVADHGLHFSDPINNEITISAMLNATEQFYVFITPNVSSHLPYTLTAISDYDNNAVSVAVVVQEAPSNNNEVSEIIKATAFVTDGKQFRDAYNDSSINRIVMENHIALNGSPNARRNSIEIDGGGYTLTVSASQQLRVDTPQAPQPTNVVPVFRMHNIHIAGASYPAVVNASGVGARHWEFEFGNLTTAPDVGRLAIVRRANVTLFGYVNLNTRAENFHLGSLRIADGAYYVGNINHFDYAVVSFEDINIGNDATGDNNFIIGGNATVRFRNTGVISPNFPAVSRGLKNTIVGHNSILDIDIGNQVAFRFEKNNSIFEAHEGAIVSLRRNDAGNVIHFNNNNNSFIMHPGSELYTKGTINLGTGSRLELNNPKAFDLQAYGNNNVFNTSASSEVLITNTDIFLWGPSASITGAAAITEYGVSSFSIVGNNYSISSHPALNRINMAGDANNQRRRIAGLNQQPRVELLHAVTDAQLMVEGIVNLGYSPYDDRVQTRMIPPIGMANVFNYSMPPTRTRVMTNPSHTNVEVTDTRFARSIFPLVNRGTVAHPHYTFQFTSQDFQIANGSFITSVQIPNRMPYDNIATVVRVAPPKITVDQTTIRRGQKTVLTGMGEPGATVMIEVNGVLVNENTTVAANGTWALALTTTLASGDSVQILSNDNTGLLTTQDLWGHLSLPTTNNNQGNETPRVDTVFLDRTFPAGPILTVSPSLIGPTDPEDPMDDSVYPTHPTDPIDPTVPDGPTGSTDPADPAGPTGPTNNVVGTSPDHSLDSEAPYGEDEQPQSPDDGTLPVDPGLKLSFLANLGSEVGSIFPRTRTETISSIFLSAILLIAGITAYIQERKKVKQ